MPLSPSQILSANSRLFGGGGGGSDAVSMVLAAKQAKRDEVDRLLAEEEEDKDSPGIWDRVKSGVGGVIEPVARGADWTRAAVVGGAVELGDLLANAAGVDSADDASWDDLRHNVNRRIGFGDVLEESTVTDDLPLNVKRVLGGVGDLALDPLNYVTLGQGTAAKAGLKRLGARAGEEVAETAAREGLPAAERLLARNLAEEEAAAAAKEAAKAGILPGLPGAGPVGASVAGSAPRLTVRDILAEGATQRGLDRTLRQIERTGKGGIGFDFGRLGAPRLGNAQLRAIPGIGAAGGAGADVFRAGTEAFKQSDVGRGIRKAIVPYTATRDKFNDFIADAIPGIGHRRAQLVDSAKLQLDQRIEPLLKGVSPQEIGVIRTALDFGGDVDGALDQLVDMPEAQNLLREMAAMRDETYDAWVAAGKKPDQLMNKTDYLRHRLTEAGKEKFGITPGGRGLPGTKSGNLKQRVFGDKTIAELNQKYGDELWDDDPATLIGSSWIYANEVLGNAGAVDALENVAKNIKGFDVSRVVSRKAKKGFVQVSPKGWVAPEIYDDLFNLAKSGTQSRIVRGWDTFSSIVKRQTLFNIIAFGPYFSQNMATGVAMNAARFGVGPADYARMFGIRKAIKQAAKAGEKDLDNVLATLLTGEDLALARAMRAEGLISPKRSLFDDVAEADTPFVKPSKARWVAELGTHKTAEINQFGEEMLRGSAFMKAMEQGVPANQASDLVRSTHLDYTALGRTRFERDKINRFIFFPTWLLRAPTAIVKSYAHHPALFNVQAKLELGKNWSERPRNEYGDIIGSRWSGPASFLSGLSFEGGDAFDSPIDLTHPVLKAALSDDPRDRSITSVLPPLSNVLKDEGGPTSLNFGQSRLGKVLSDEDDRQGRYLKSLGGFRYGVDYEAERGEEQFEEMLAERRAEIEAGAEKPETTQKIRLVLAALREGVPAADAYSLSKAGLAKALVKKGVSKKEIADILADKDATLPDELPSSEVQGILGGGLDSGPVSDAPLAAPGIDFGGDGKSDNLIDLRDSDDALMRIILERMEARPLDIVTGLRNVRRNVGSVIPRG